MLRRRDFACLDMFRGGKVSAARQNFAVIGFGVVGASGEIENVNHTL